MVYPWKSAHVIATIVVGALLLIGFGFYQAYGNLTEPLLPLGSVRDPGLMAAIIIWAIGAVRYTTSCSSFTANAIPVRVLRIRNRLAHNGHSLVCRRAFRQDVAWLRGPRR